jgi:hypothetical protein
VTGHNTPTAYTCLEVAVPYQNVVATIDDVQGGEIGQTTGDPFTACIPDGDLQIITNNSSGSAVERDFYVVFN